VGSRAAGGRAWSFNARMAEARTTAVARATVAAITTAAIAVETARLARLIIARRLLFVFPLRLRFLLCSLRRRRDIKRIVRMLV
jgi:hypothetical protein